MEDVNDYGRRCCLTFDMSGGPKGAKRPLERPLDGGVRRHLPEHRKRNSTLAI